MGTLIVLLLPFPSALSTLGFFQMGQPGFSTSWIFLKTLSRAPLLPLTLDRPQTRFSLFASWLLFFCWLALPATNRPLSLPTCCLYHQALRILPPTDLLRLPAPSHSLHPQALPAQSYPNPATGLPASWLLQSIVQMATPRAS